MSDLAVSVLIVVGYVLFVPLVWQVGNIAIRIGIIDRLGTRVIVDTAPGGALPDAPARHERVREPADDPEMRKRETRELKAGRVIGALERLLIVAGLVLGRWEVLVAVITLKTVARFPELERQLKAEYFLIGSLASVLWAVLSAVALLLYDRGIGFALFPADLLTGAVATVG